LRILIVSPEGDFHASVVSARLQDCGHNVTIFNATWFPGSARMSWRPNASLYGQLFNSENFDLSSFDRVWWRRFRKPTLDPRITDENVKQFCQYESLYLMRSAFLLRGDFVINDPCAEFSASHKPTQLEAATQISLKTPDTLISNDYDEIESFTRTHERVVYKTLVCRFPHNVSTRELTLRDLNGKFDRDMVSYAPTIYQELVEAKLDIRVTVVGDRVFAGELFRDSINEIVDWRMTATGWKAHELPAAVENKLVQITRRLGLVMASHDLRLGLDGAYYFIETNPSGQFLFLEIDAGLPISEAVGTTLIQGYPL
jgi:glutathione synthase/RimK-type ligase-like ATP-grasp enzyme